MIAKELSPDVRGWIGLGQARRRYGLSPIVVLRAACLGLVQFAVAGGRMYFEPSGLAKLPPSRMKRKAG